MKKIIEKVFYKNKLILGAVLLAVLLIAGIQFYVTDFSKNTPKEQEQTQSVEKIQPPAPLIRKDTYTITSENPPYIVWASFDPLDYKIGETQIVEVKIENELPVDRVSVTMLTDNQEKTYELELVEGTTEKGTWQGSWVVIEDTKDFRYQAALEAQNTTESSKVVVTFR